MGKEYNDNDLIPVLIGEKYGFINLKGDVVISPQYDSAGHFHCGLAYVEVNGKAGFIDELGVLVIPIKFASARIFRDGLCTASLNGEDYGVIDRHGDFVIEPRYLDVDVLWDGVCIITDKSANQGLADANGIIVKPQFNWIDTLAFGKHAYGLRMDGEKSKYGLAIRNGVVLYPQYDDISYIFEGVFEVCIDDKYGLISIDGRELAPMEYEQSFLEMGGYTYSYLNDCRVFFNYKGEQIWKECKSIWKK